MFYFWLLLKWFFHQGPRFSDYIYEFSVIPFSIDHVQHDNISSHCLVSVLISKLKEYCIFLTIKRYLCSLHYKIHRLSCCTIVHDNTGNIKYIDYTIVHDNTSNIKYIDYTIVLIDFVFVQSFKSRGGQAYLFSAV